MTSNGTVWMHRVNQEALGLKPNTCSLTCGHSWATSTTQWWLTLIKLKNLPHGRNSDNSACNMSCVWDGVAAWAYEWTCECMNTEQCSTHVIDLSRQLRWRIPYPNLTFTSKSPLFIVSFLLPHYISITLFLSSYLSLLPHFCLFFLSFSTCSYSSFTCFLLSFFICISFSYFLPIFLSLCLPFPHSILLSTVLHIVISFSPIVLFFLFHSVPPFSFHRNPASLSELPSPECLIPVNMISPLPAGTMTAENVLAYMHSLFNSNVKLSA